MARSWHTSKPPNKDEAHDIYVTYWTTHNFHRGLQNLFTPDFFYGQKTALAQSENYIGNLPISLPLSIFFHDPVALLNSTSIAVFILSLWGSYLLCYWFSRNVFASILASTAANFYSNRLVNWGWLNLHSIHWLPFAILAFILLLKRKKTGYGFLFVIFFFLQATTNGYYGPVLLCIIMLIALSYYVFNPKKWNWNRVLTIALIIIICIAAIYPVYSIYRKTAQDVKMYRPDYSIIQWSSTISGDLSTSSILLENIVGKNSDCDSNNAAKGGQFPGFLFLIFFFYFFSFSIKDQNKQKEVRITTFQIIRLIILVVFILILLFGILAVTCAGITDSITAKEIIFLLLLIILVDAVFRFLISENRKTLAAGLLIAGLCLFAASFGPEFTIFGKTFRTFYYYLHENISFLHYYRGLSRLSLLFMQLFAPLTACGIAVFLERIGLKNRKIAVFASIFLFAFILCETRVKMNILPVEEKCPKQYQLIKESKENIVLLELPISRSNHEAVYHQLYHGKKLVNGISERYFPEIMKLKFMMNDFPGKNSIEYAEKYGITHILINDLNPVKKEKILKRLSEWQGEIQIFGVYEHEVLVTLKTTKKE